MGRSSSKPLQKPNNPLQEMEYKESQRERTRLQQEKEKKQILRLQKKQAKKQRKNKRKKISTRSQATDQIAASAGHRLQGGICSDNLNQQISSSCQDMSGRADLNRQLDTKLQKQLNENLCEFILNQIASNVQFFKNFDSELSAATEYMLDTEKHFNQNLEEHSILLTNPLDLAVSKWISYKPSHGPDKYTKQPLQNQTMYVVFENIDIARPNDANYDSISPLCKVDIELDFRESTPCREDFQQLLSNIKWKGYVRLRLREENKKPQTDFDELYSEGSSGYCTASPYSSKPALNVVDDCGEQEYDYAFLTHLNTQHPLKELKMSNSRERNKIDAEILPESCISSLGDFVPALNAEEFSDEEDESESEYEDSDDGVRRQGCFRDFDTLQAIKLHRMEMEKRRKLLAQNYLNSREFMKYFGELVSEKLAPKLQIAEEELQQANYRGTSIYTHKYELIPAIYAAQNVADWPKCAFEFRLRDRPIVMDTQTGQQIQWPSRAMIKRIEAFGFHVIPLGYAAKKKRNPFRDIEWRIVFPKAERYLEQHLTSTQIKVYMITKALLKSFVEPVESNKALMFALDHLRMHLFWECERDYTAWPEEFLGEVLLRFINSFKQRVREKQLSDYFIRERNLFENIPEYSLNSLYTILADITANPLMHIMIAFRNLEFGTDFWPKLNYRKLYQNLRENEIVKLKSLARNGRSLMSLHCANEDETCLLPDEGAQGLVGLKQHHVRTNGKLRRKTQLLRHNLEIKKQEMQAKRRSVESLDVEFFFKSNIKSCNTCHINRGLENLRRTNILEIFVDHLLEMATAALQFENISQAKIYLSQARRLCKFYHNLGCDLGAKGYLTSIHNVDEELQILHGKLEFTMAPPSLPRRISIETVLPEVPTCRHRNSLNLYEEMVPKEKLEEENEKRKKENTFKNVDSSPGICSELRNSLKCSNIVVEIKSDKGSPVMPPSRVEIKACLKPVGNFASAGGKTKSPESRKSIKFRDKVVTVQSGETISIQRPQGYSPISILRSLDKPFGDNAMETQDVIAKEKIRYETNKTGDKSTLVSSYLRGKLKSSKEFINTSPLGNSEMFQSLSQNANQFLHNLTDEDHKTQIRELLKRKTLQLKGALNQSSES